MVYALHSCRMFIMGCPNLLVAVDHKPLIKIFNDRALESINNPRILQMKEKTLMYNFRIVHIPGKFNEAPDAASRYPTRSDGEDGGIDQESSEAASIEFAAHQAEGVRSLTWSDVVQAAIPDEECASLVRQIEIGFPEERDAVPNEIRQFWAMRDDLYVVQNVPFRGRRMLVPKLLRPQVLEGLHAAHQGVNGMLANARERLFWPGLDAAVRLTRAQCRQCNEHSPSQAREPAIETVEPDIPFQQVVMDLFDLAGHQFLVYADRYSGWVEVVKLRTATFKNMQQILLRWFSTFGVPEELSTDGGPPFNSNEYTVFLRTWGIRKRMSSAYFPQSNGRAEAVVKSAKRILLGNINPATGQIETDEATRALLLHRNTPAQDTGISPAVSLYGCPLKDHLPHYDRAFRKEWQMIADAREVALGKRHMRPHMLEGRELECLQIGDAVQIQNQHGNRPNQWHSTGVIVEALPFRQYRVVVDGNRRTTLRNRRYLRKMDPVCRKIQNVDGVEITAERINTDPPIMERSTDVARRNTGVSTEAMQPNRQPHERLDPPSPTPAAAPPPQPEDQGRVTTPLPDVHDAHEHSREPRARQQTPPSPMPERGDASTHTERGPAQIRRSTRMRKKPDRLDL